ncbi:hypothetical protein S7335_2665 [Synechococcus sp. PCC 7335]|nr:hypothetical protein S7335_2665 [Synechococcus sp. PCC 7335]
MVAQALAYQFSISTIPKMLDEITQASCIEQKLTNQRYYQYLSMAA